MSIANSYDALRNQAEREYPESWIPCEDNPTLVGEFVRLESGTTRFGPCPIVVVKQEDGTERSLWLLHTALKSQFKQARPKPGQLIAVRYLGKKQGREGQEYVAYKVTVHHDEAAPDWDALDGDDDDSAFDVGSVDWGQKLKDTDSGGGSF